MTIDSLAQRYREFTNEQLLSLYRDRHNLTDAAQATLAGELQSRGLTGDQEQEEGFTAGIPGVFPSGAAVVEQALEPGGQERFGRVNLVSFYDGIELSRACMLLEQAEIALEIESRPGDALSGAGPHFVVWVQPKDREHAESILRARMGLFPLAEVDPARSFTADQDGLVGQFESQPEAQEIAQILLEAGFTPSIRHEDDSYRVEVLPGETESALHVLSSRLELE